MRFAILAAVFAVTLSGMASAEETCPPLKVVASLDMTVERGRILIPVTVGDDQVYFTVGTAQPYSAISIHFAKQHKFTRLHSNINFVGLNGEISNVAAILPSLTVGRLKSENVQVITLDMHDDAAPPDAHVARGVFGADFLRGYDVEFDFAAGKLNLISRDHCDTMPVYWASQTLATVPMIVTDSNKISFRMTLDGHELQTVLNTAIAGSTIRMNIAKEVFGIDNDSPGSVRVGTMGNGTPLYAHRFQSLGVDGLAISNPLLVLMPSLADQTMEHMHNIHVSPTRGPMYLQKQPELVLGLNELKKLHVYIDYHHQTVYFTPATSAEAQPKPASTAP